jgi:hypothetical protein
MQILISEKCFGRSCCSLEVVATFVGIECLPFRLYSQLCGQRKVLEEDRRSQGLPKKFATEPESHCQALDISWHAQS